MKVVILAAGMGSRLGKDLPKPLTVLANGKSILQMQLDYLSSYVSLKEIVVVVGHQKEVFLRAFPELSFIYNPNFAQTNTAKSLLCALEEIEEDLLWLNGDVVFKKEILNQPLSNYQNWMVVNTSYVDEEEVKYRTNGQGKIVEVSKKVKHPEGEALGINFFTKKDLFPLKENLRCCLDEDYFEQAIEFCIEQGVNVWAAPVLPSQCVEVDFQEDLDRANAMVERFAKDSKKRKTSV